MKIFISYSYSLLILAIGILSFFTDWYGPLSIALTILLMVMIIDKMGKGIVLRESTAMLYVITCILMPLMGYAYYTINNPLARMYSKFMPVPEKVYFEFALPAVTLFCLALTLPLGIKRIADQGETLTLQMENIKRQLGNQKNMGIYLMVAGVISGAISRFLPGGLQFFAVLLYFGSFAGLLYVYFAPPFPRKKLIIGGFMFFIISNALASGMFTVVAYMSVTIYSFFVITKSQSFFKKLVIVMSAIVFMIILQNTKAGYRKVVWRSAYQGNSIALFSKLFIQNMQLGDALIEKKAFFPLYVRTNQGFNVALVMRRLPSKIPHDNGTNLLRAFGSAFVPRFLWPDKPEAGGKFNMKYYAGMTIRGYSTNIGPLGEAYGSFGVRGGIFYMFFLGLFIRFAYSRVFVIAKHMPLLIFWIPVLFYQVTYSGENDTLQIINSLIKAAFFIFILYKLWPKIFKPETKPEDAQKVFSNQTTPGLQTS